MAKKLSKEQWEQRIRDAGAGRYEFVRWAVEGKHGVFDKVIVKCLLHKNEWETAVNNLTNKGHGCNICNLEGKKKLFSMPNDVAIKRINDTGNGRLSFLRWLDGIYVNQKSIAVCLCKKCGREFKASSDSLINKSVGCRSCGVKSAAIKRTISEIDRIDLIKKSLPDTAIFIGWVDGYKNQYSKANVKCKVDWFTWSATVNNIVSKGSGCPQCAGLRRWTAEERIEQINSLDNITFTKWNAEYHDKYSKAVVCCGVCGLEWSSSVGHLVNTKRGCPSCANTGYDQCKTGTLYALRSECGKYVKVGISNKPSQRHKQLERSTPFGFKVIEEIEGNGAFIAELERHLKSKYNRAGLNGFDGYTEWLICTSDLLEELRNLRGKL